MQQIKEQVQHSKDYFLTHETKSIKFRKKQLKCLSKSIKQHETALKSALLTDLGKGSIEAYATEIGYTLSSIKLMRKSIDKWSKKQAVDTPVYLFPAKSFIVKEPLGTVLIIGPFNYPFQLLFEPLIGAIAAGNTAIIKPSELTPNVAKVVENIITDTFEPEYVSVVQGGPDVIQTLLEQPFDHIFFTGSERVGKIVYKAAAEQLIPVTLELGGKSPVIIDKTANLKVASERISFGKFINTGQTCVAPDYILIDESIKEPFIHALRTTLKEFYGSHPLISEDLGHIVNERHFDRLAALMDAQKEQCIIGGERNATQRRIAPSIYDNVTVDDPLMQEEIFGPLLPIMTYKNIDDAFQFIQSRPKPLALYLFSEDENTSDRVLDELSFGGGAINDTLLHLANPNLPFGGVGASGIGQYHGKYSFDTFTHEKSYIFKTTKLESSLLFPPYQGKLDAMKKLFKK
ncbi:aldehyde dehydrogenase [Staphylococcus muscae]|uniref:Aldehyde dehydrogenase n=1 Tax=Staphylococcus muscae TaxID=1294 RepID=A0A240C5I3_9STAP|nr:aldehyde dehydrogenase [Staphylococcus muscae]AVQ33434.1 aldehyde dehydrogenase [Staphylococcus muscae]PNZ04334.1 aldehyde dehydrogenase [Staphylococcus muscae]GGA90140.1 aldehyde dehydrogenase [Staphylococcus muscae]SNW03244.1 aldehyde dehydrogenase [Staphylococcus muscae]